MISRPPIVGVPDFSIWPSKPRSLTDSPTCNFFKERMIFLPNSIVIINDNMTAIADLNDIN